MWLGAMIVLVVLLLLAIGFASGYTTGLQQGELNKSGALDELARRRTRDIALRDQKIDYLNRQLIAYHGPADWEARFQRELEREQLEQLDITREQ